MNNINEVCIVDDDKITIMLTKKRLEMAKFTSSIISFENGKDVYDNFTERLKNNQKLPDLVLLDLNMPIWDGWDFLDELNKINDLPEICIFIITSSINPLDKDKAKNYKIVKDFLIKPIDEKILLDAIERYNK